MNESKSKILNNELISIIIPVWKPDITHLKECIDSVIVQTFSNLEIILIYKKEPNFDDKFYELISKYKDSRLKVLTSKEVLSAAINFGIISSHGQYIARLDADDISEKERFEKQFRFKKEKKYDIVGSWAFNISNNGQIIAKIRYPIEHDEIRKKIMLHDLILNSSVLMDRKMLDDIGLYDINLSGSEDYDLWFRAIARGYRLGNIPEYLVRIRENPNSVTRSNTWRKHRITSMKVRNKAFFKYGFRRPRDIFYHVLTPLSFFIYPKLLIKIKKKMGWYQ